MKAIIEALGNFWDKYIVHPLSHFSPWDALDILLLAVLLYGVYLFFKGRRAGKLSVGLVLLFLLYAVSDALELRAMHSIMEGVAPYTIILLAVIFQTEIRDALEKLGSSPFGLLARENRDRAELSRTVNEVVDAACRIAMSGRDGALIVIERSTKLGDYADKGQQLDAQVSSNLLCNIFVDRSPLHDGAVIIRDNRIATAASKLPLSVNEEVVRGMGTRHRAAVGITEVSDCVAVVVSEERHTISIANNGYIKRDYHRSPDELRSENAMKNIQNSLRNDLFRLLAGVDFDEEEKRKKKRKSSSSGSRRSGGKSKAPQVEETKVETPKMEEASEQLSIEMIVPLVEETTAETAAVETVVAETTAEVTDDSAERAERAD